MARGTIHPKKENSRNRNGTPHGTKTYPRESVLRGPEIHEVTFRSDWKPYTLRWWETWRRAPQAVDFLDTDWNRLGLLAPVIDDMAGGRVSAAALAEVRMNEERLGATFVDRMRARIYVEPDTESDQPGDVIPIRRARRTV